MRSPSRKGGVGVCQGRKKPRRRCGRNDWGRRDAARGRAQTPGILSNSNSFLSFPIHRCRAATRKCASEDCATPISYGQQELAERGFEMLRKDYGRRSSRAGHAAAGVLLLIVVAMLVVLGVSRNACALSVAEQLHWDLAVRIGSVC